MARRDSQRQPATELCAAITLYRALDMSFWLPQAEAYWQGLQQFSFWRAKGSRLRMDAGRVKVSLPRT
jgi:hypothetical protein